MKRKNSIATRAFEVLRNEGVIVFFWKALAHINAFLLVFRHNKLEFLILPYVFLKIKKFNQNGLNDLVSFCFYSVAGSIRPLQVKNEILELLKIVGRMKPRVILEIGTANGGTLFLFSRVASENATIISIDFPDRRFGGGYPKWRGILYRAFALPGQRIYLLRADSHNRETLEQVKRILDGNGIDFLFIDGDHTYEGVKKDFEFYSPLVKKGGIIALHDIVVHPPDTGCEVSKFWNEIKEQKHEYAEIVGDRNQNWGGIGLLFMNFKR